METAEGEILEDGDHLVQQEENENEDRNPDDGSPRALRCGRLGQTPRKDQSEQPVEKL